MDDLDAAVALVYAQPPSGFVVARSALVKELKAAKRKEDAARVAALRRPTKLAWAVGEAARKAPEAAESFFAAIMALAEPGSGGTTQPAGSGGTTQPAGDLRRHTANLRHAVASLVGGVEGVDHGEATAAFMAIAADPEATEALRLGRLADIPAGGGFGGLAAGFGPPAQEAAAPKATPEPGDEGEPEDEAETAAAGAAAGAAARRERDARDRAERKAALEAERAEAAEAEAAAAARVDAAQAALEAAQAELAEATATLEERRASLRALEERLQEEATAAS